ncbi:MAG: prepilin-type N-terminal cleavage/methylation domain-containing protein, partial [Candidatus Eremiobacterota bacterium]
MRRRGFSLAEVLLVLALMAILLTSAVSLARPAASRASARAVAEHLAQQLRAVRQQALASGEPAALVLPGGTGHTASYYVAAGRERPVVTRRVRLDREFPGVAIFRGRWDTVGASVTTSPGTLATKEGPFRLSDWVLPSAGDAALVFHPSGAVLAEGDEVARAFHLVVAGGLRYTREGSSWRLDQARDPWTVSVSRGGEVRLSRGIPYAAPSVETGAPIGFPGPTAPLSVSPFQAPNRDPELSGPVTVWPLPNPRTLHTGIDATVRPDGFLTLELRADDPDGEALTCLWRTTDPGGFSSEFRTEMHFDPGQQNWVSRWEFHPPPGAAPESVYTLRCDVWDPRGGRVEGRIGASGQVQVLRRQRLAFTDRVAGTVLACNEDGTGLLVLTDDLPDIFPSREFWSCGWSPDGSKLLLRNRFDTSRDGMCDLYVVNQDGSGVLKLVDTRAAGYDRFMFAAFSPDGTRVVCTVQDPAGNLVVALVNADGTHPDNPAVRAPKTVHTTGIRIGNVNWYTALSWHPRSERILFGAREASLSSGDVMEFDLATPTAPPVPIRNQPGLDEHEASYSQDGTAILFMEDQDKMSIHDYDVTQPVGQGLVGPARLLASGAYFNSPTSSPDGSRVVYESDTSGSRELWIMNRDGSSPRQITSDP